MLPLKGDMGSVPWHNSPMKDREVNEPRVSAIASIGRNRELGKGGTLLWRISADLRRVKALTMGHTLIMGRKTYESIGRPLPGRTNIVVTSAPHFEAPGCTLASSLEDALQSAREVEGTKVDGEIFIFGGATIYSQALPFTDRLYLTIIDAEDPAADTFFPEYKNDFTKVIEKETRGQDGLAYEWLTLER